MEVFASFAVCREGSNVWATTRDGKDAGRIGLPGGKVDAGEHPLDAARREAAEEGVAVHGDALLVHAALVEGRLVHWYEFASASPLATFKEQARGIRAVLVPLVAIAESGYGNDFLRP